MNDSFFSYLHRLELIAFFSGYPLIYAIVMFLKSKNPRRKDLSEKIASLLPFSYALTGTLFLGFELKNLSPDYSIAHLRSSMHHPYLVLWGVLSVFFWIPAVGKRTVASFLHSLVFFVLLIEDLFFQATNSGTDKNIIRNDMKLYSTSLLLNAGAFIMITLIFLFLRWLKSFEKSPAN